MGCRRNRRQSESERLCRSLPTRRENRGCRYDWAKYSKPGVRSCHGSFASKAATRNPRLDLGTSARTEGIRESKVFCAADSTKHKKFLVTSAECHRWCYDWRDPGAYSPALPTARSAFAKTDSDIAFLPIRLIPLPIDVAPRTEILQWHKYHHQDPAYVWFRGVLRPSGEVWGPSYSAWRVRRIRAS
jgi:hypothetical protein